jgi:hypothetical protein
LHGKGAGEKVKVNVNVKKMLE